MTALLTWWWHNTIPVCRQRKPKGIKSKRRVKSGLCVVCFNFFFIFIIWAKGCSSLNMNNKRVSIDYMGEQGLCVLRILWSSQTHRSVTVVVFVVLTLRISCTINDSLRRSLSLFLPLSDCAKRRRVARRLDFLLPNSAAPGCACFLHNSVVA